MCPVAHISFARIALTVLDASVYIALLWRLWNSFRAVHGCPLAARWDYSRRASTRLFGVAAILVAAIFFIATV